MITFGKMKRKSTERKPYLEKGRNFA